MSQSAFPNSDVSAVFGMTGAGTRYGCINNITDDTTYISNAWTVDQVQACGLSTVSDPTIDTGHIVHSRARIHSNNASYAGYLTLYIYQGVTLIWQGATNSFNAKEIWQNFDEPLPPAAVANITDYTNLSIRINASNQGGSGYQTDVSYAYLEVPNVPSLYPTDPLLRVTGITRTFWPGKKIYQMQINIGGNGASYIPPVDNINFTPAVPPLVTPQVQQQGINTAFIDAINQARGVGQQQGGNYPNPTMSPGIPGVPNPLPGTPGNIGNPPGNSPFVTGDTTPFQIAGPELYLDPNTGLLTRKKPK